MHYFEPQIERNLTEMNYVVTLWKITRRSIDRFSILMAQNDRQVLSFRLRGRSTSGLCEKFLPQQKRSRGGLITSPPASAGVLPRPLKNLVSLISGDCTPSPARRALLRASPRHQQTFLEAAVPQRLGWLGSGSQATLRT